MQAIVEKYRLAGLRFLRYKVVRPFTIGFPRPTTCMPFSALRLCVVDANYRPLSIWPTARD
jgi:hypothetical protein